MSELIQIRRLAVMAKVGITAEERAFPQRLELCVTIQPEISFAEMADRIEQTVDYAKVTDMLISECAARPRELIETLAWELAQRVVGEFPAASATVEVRKFILPQVDYVSVQATAGKSGE